MMEPTSSRQATGAGNGPAIPTGPTSTPPLFGLVLLVSPWSPILLGLAALALAAASLGISRSALHACGFDGLGFIASGCAVPRSERPVSPDHTLAALEAESEQLQRLLRLAKAALRTPARCAPGEIDRRATGPAINDQTWQRRDLAALEGCWELNTDYRFQDVQTSVVRSATNWSVCFDRAGKGRQKIELTGGNVCEAPVEASFPAPDQLQLRDVTDIPCTGGLQIFQRVVECRRQDSAEIACSSRQPARANAPSRVGLRRKADGG